MADQKKLSQIDNGKAYVLSTDKVVSVRNGNTDVQTYVSPDAFAKAGGQLCQNIRGLLARVPGGIEPFTSKTILFVGDSTTVGQQANNQAGGDCVPFNITTRVSNALNNNGIYTNFQGWLGTSVSPARNNFDTRITVG